MGVCACLSVRLCVSVLHMGLSGRVYVCVCVVTWMDVFLFSCAWMNVCIGYRDVYTFVVNMKKSRCYVHTIILSV